ncbi:MAG: right-handed parallel beta-helix repeat-containing protein [Candidatus Aenigmarchaeota archaeon]|nr:right-handed parallel beta-helix repeat-containing protein [Candidatus Aenigmarchaeota archaeon]
MQKLVILVVMGVFLASTLAIAQLAAAQLSTYSGLGSSSPSIATSGRPKPTTLPSQPGPIVTILSPLPDLQVEYPGQVLIQAQVTYAGSLVSVKATLDTPSGPQILQMLKNGNVYEATFNPVELGQYALQVVAKPKILNAPSGIALSGFAVVDTTPPEVTVLVPNGETFEQDEPVTVTAEVTDNFGIASVTAEVTLPDLSVTQVTLTPSGSTYEGMFTSTTLGGDYMVQVLAIDLASKPTTAVGLFTIDLAPAILATSPTVGQVINGPVNVAPAPVTLSMTVNEPLEQATYSVDGSPFLSMVQQAGNTWEVQVSLARGSHEVTFHAVDLAGKVTDTPQIPFTVYLTATAASCTEASDRLNGYFDKVTLTQTINNFDGTCATFNADNVVFNGGGFTIDGNDDHDADVGVNLNGRSQLVVEDLSIRDFAVGVFDDLGSDNVILRNLVVFSNEEHGISWSGGDGFNIYDNNVFGNDGYGVFGGNTMTNNIYSNVISENLAGGMGFDGVKDSVIASNDITFNSIAGLEMLFSTTGNAIYSNNFIENNDGLNQVYLSTSATSNIWISGQSGNYWSNFDESSEGCVDDNSDMICDSFYTDPGIGLQVQDDYPSVSPF